MQKILAPSRLILSLITAFTWDFSLKKMLNFALDQKPQTNELLSYKPLYLCIEKIFSMMKSFQNGTMISMQSLETMRL